MGDVYSGKDWRFGFAQEALFGTAIGDSSAFNELSCSPFTINRDLKFYEINRNLGQRWHDVNNLLATTKGSVATATISTHALKAELDYWLYLVIQYVVEGASTPYTKTFSFPSAANTPDFVSNEGCFITLCRRAPISSISEKATSMVGRKLELSIAPDANEGMLHASIELVGGRGMTFTSNPSGTWTRASLTGFHFNDINTFTVGGYNCILKEWKLTIESNVVPVGSGTNGLWSNYALAGWKATSEFTVINDSYARTALSAAHSNTKQDVVLNWGTAGTDGNLNFAYRGKFDEPTAVDGDTADISFRMTLASDISASESALTITLSNAIDRNW